MLKKFTLILSLTLFGCTLSTDQHQAVKGFESEKYLGTWYEIARLDNSFEKGLNRVTATYSKREDNGIRVINRGYEPIKKKWAEVEGKAYFIENQDTGKLKVSFFGPFYGPYTIVALDKLYYNYAMVTSGNNYLWILSRTPQLPYPIKQELVAQAKELGFDTDKLVYVVQDAPIIEYKAGPHVN